MKASVIISFNSLRDIITLQKAIYIIKNTILGLCIILFCTSCSQDTYQLTVTASTPYLELVEALARQFQREYNIIVSVKGTLGQEELLINKNLTDLILVDKKIKDKSLEVKHFASEQTQLIINSSNTLNSITQDKLESIYQGQVTNWQNISPDSELNNIQILTREPSSGIKNSFLKYYLPNTEYISLMALTVNTNAEMQSAVANMPNSIGYVSLGSLSQIHHKIKIISVYNSQDQLIKIPETKIYYIWDKKNSNEYLDKFIEFINNSPQAKQLIQERGLIVYNK